MHDMKTAIAFQGTLGAYSEEAIWDYSKTHDILLEPLPTENFSDLFAVIERGIGLGMVPIENSTTGSVIQSYDLLLEHPNLTIIGEHTLPIHHHLLANKGVSLSDIKRVWSHPQAISQCQPWLDRHGLIAEHHFDTAGSAKELSESPQSDLACIASVRAAETYGLDILADTIQTNTNNKTRFLLVKNKDKTFSWEKVLPTANKTSLVFSGKNVPASLYKCLGGFATNGVDLLKLETRPKQGQNWEYVSFLDFSGNPSETSVQNALEELAFYTDHLTILGTYPAFSDASE